MQLSPWLICWLILGLFITCSADRGNSNGCRPLVLEGVAVTYTYLARIRSSRDLRNPLVWQILQSGSTRNVSLCYTSNQTCHNRFPSLYSATINLSGYSPGRPRVNASLTLKSVEAGVSRIKLLGMRGTLLDCVVDGRLATVRQSTSTPPPTAPKLTTTYYLFAPLKDIGQASKPSQPICEEPYMARNYTKIECFVQQTNPKTLCRLHAQPDWTYDVRYNETFCVLLLSYKSLLPPSKNYTFRVLGYFNETNNVTYGDLSLPFLPRFYRFAAFQMVYGVMLHCEAPSTREFYTMSLYKDKQLVYTSPEKNTLDYILTDLACTREKPYFECRGKEGSSVFIVGGIGLETHCPLQLTTPAVNNSLIRVTHETGASLVFRVSGHPGPIQELSSLYITRVSEGPVNPTRRVSPDVYTIEYAEYSDPGTLEYFVNVTLTKWSDSNKDRYIVSLNNGVGGNLKVMFYVLTASPEYGGTVAKETSNVGLMVAVFVIPIICVGVLLVVVIVCYRRRMKQKREAGRDIARQTRRRRRRSHNPRAVPNCYSMVYSTSSSAAMLQFEPPPPYDLSTVPDTVDGRENGVGQELDPQCLAIMINGLPAYDSIAKPSEPPPPYTSV